MTTTQTPPRWQRLLGYGGGFVLGAVLLVAAVAKAIDPVAFAEQIAAERIAGPVPVVAVAFLALALEAGLGLALVLGVRRLPVLVPAALLVAFFLLLTGRGAWRAAQGIAPETSCGCFGNLVERTPLQAFWQDALLMVPPLLLAFVGRSREAWPRLRLATVAAGTAGLLTLGWAAPRLPLDDLATRLSPGTAIDSLCAGEDPRICLGDLAPELHDGERWVTLVDLKDDPASWVDELNALAMAGAPLVVLADSTPEELHAFTWEWGPAFALREVPAPVLRPLYRTLPRSFLVREGEVVLTSSGLPVTAALPATSQEPKR